MSSPGIKVTLRKDGISASHVEVYEDEAPLDVYEVLRSKKKQEPSKTFSQKELELAQGNSEHTSDLSRHLFELIKKNDFDDFILLQKTLQYWTNLGIAESIINFQNGNGETPLMLACQLGKAKPVALLLNVPGIKPNLLDTKGKSALHHAAENGNSEVCKCLFKNRNFDQQLLLKPLPHLENTPLSVAAIKGHVELVKLFVAQFVSQTQFTCNVPLVTFLQAQDVLGATALDWAKALSEDKPADEGLQNIKPYAHRILGAQKPKEDKETQEKYNEIVRFLTAALKFQKIVLSSEASLNLATKSPTSTLDALLRLFNNPQHDVRTGSNGNTAESKDQPNPESPKLTS